VRITVEFNGDVAIMRLSGKFLAGGDGPFLRQKVKDLIDAGAAKLAIDLSRVPVIDSTGLGFLAGTRVTAQNAGCGLVLVSPNPHVKKILDQIQLTQVFTIAEDEATALAKLKETRPPSQSASPRPAKTTRARKHSPAPTE